MVLADLTPCSLKISHMDSSPLNCTASITTGFFLNFAISSSFPFKVWFGAVIFILFQGVKVAASSELDILDGTRNRRRLPYPNTNVRNFTVLKGFPARHRSGNKHAHTYAGQVF